MEKKVYVIICPILRQTAKDRVIDKTLELSKENQQGLRYIQLLDQIAAVYPVIPPNTIQGVLVTG